MACRISELVIKAENPKQLGAFWCEVLGYVPMADQDDDGSMEIGPPGTEFGSPYPTLLFLPSTDTKQGTLPLHIDVNATDRDQDAELERLLAAGARKIDIGQSDDASWHVLADPEGNEFCLLRPRLEPIEY